MFGPISTLPALLPNLYGLTGQAIPKQIAEFIQPTMDINELLSAGNALEVVLPASINANATGYLSPPELVVPGGEAWLVRGFNINCTTLVGEAIRGQAVITRANVAPIVIRTLGEFYSSPSDTAGVAAPLVAAQSSFLLAPGEQIGAWVQKIITAGNISVGFRAEIFRFQV